MHAGLELTFDDVRPQDFHIWAGLGEDYETESGGRTCRIWPLSVDVSGDLQDMVGREECWGTGVLRADGDVESSGNVMVVGKMVEEGLFVCWLVGCLTSQQHASISQGRICSDNLTCCHTEIEVADQTFHLTQSQYTDTGPTSPSADPITPGAWQDSHWSANV